MFVTCPKCDAQYQISEKISLKENQKCQCSACGEVFSLQSEKPTSEMRELAQKVKETPVLQQKTVPLKASEPKKTVSEREEKSKPAPESFIPEEFKPVEEKPTFSVRKRIALWLGVMLLVFIAFVGLVDTPLSRHLKTATDDFVSDMIPRLHLPDFSAMRKDALTDTADFEQPSSDEGVPTPESDLDLDVLSESVVEATPEVMMFRGVTVRLKKNTEGPATTLVEGMIFNVSDKNIRLPEFTIILKDRANLEVGSQSFRIHPEVLAGMHAVSFSQEVVPAAETAVSADISY